jgi:hypothetical protein
MLIRRYEIKNTRELRSEFSIFRVTTSLKRLHFHNCSFFVLSAEHVRLVGSIYEIIKAR